MAQNAETSDNDVKKDEFMIMTANEVTNVLGESYKTVAKRLNALVTQGKITVTEKAVNNRLLKGYKLSVSDLQSIKDKFIQSKHSENGKNAPNVQMFVNELNTRKNTDLENESLKNPNVKFYEVVQENAELAKELDKLKADMQLKINENVRLDADLTVARSELKFIEDKSKAIESAFSEQKLEVERLNRVVKHREIALIVLGAIILMGLTIVAVLAFVRGSLL